MASTVPDEPAPDAAPDVMPDAAPSWGFMFLTGDFVTTLTHLSIGHLHNSSTGGGVMESGLQPFMFDRAAETMPRRNLAALQLLRLRASLTHAYERVPHFRRKFDAAGVTPDSLGTLADIARFPFTL